MFQQLDLKYFRQHTDLTVNFEPGVVALRGRNEAGKSTILEAMAYAMFGATALREALEDVVTWGRKVSELKVKLDFHLNGVDYRIHRSKSGAEIKTGERILATGQKEVTKYVESLLGASQEVCTKLMLASQDDIKGALSKGPSAAIELIEALSNLGVIDTIISLVQAQLPCGTTTAVQARVEMLAQQVEVPIADDTEPLADLVKKATDIYEAAVGDYNDTKDRYDDVSPAAAEAQLKVDTHDRLVTDEARAKADYERAKVTFEALVIPPLPTNTEELRRAVTDAQFMVRAWHAAEAVKGIKVTETEWEGDYDSLIKDRDAQATVLKEQQRIMHDCDTKIARLEAQKITQTACGLCGKDLSNVPEVVTKNAELEKQIAALYEQRIEASSAGEAASSYVNLCNSILTVHSHNMAIYQRANEFVRLDHGFVPPRWEWTGPAETITVNTVAARDLQQAEAAERAHHAAVGRQQALQGDMSRLEAAWGTVKAKLVAATAALKGTQAALDRAAQALQALNAADAVVKQTQEAVRAARQTLEVAEAGLRERVNARKLLEAQLVAARAELTEMDDNNALIKFLRDARPAITDQLWGMVMTLVSSYFSDIRGTQSVVTRADNGFKVDGHSVAGCSGSTKDALGLAIRKACTKTFLPNASFLMLDEPAAACDDEREGNMLGLIAAGGFEQVILITHSDLADSFANQVVQL